MYEQRLANFSGFAGRSVCSFSVFAKDVEGSAVRVCACGSWQAIWMSGACFEWQFCFLCS